MRRLFETYTVHPEGFHNVERDGKAIGYEVRLRIPYYRGIPMSCVDEITLAVDGEEAPKDAMTITVKGEQFAYGEISTAINHRWEFTDTITVFVAKEGGLAAGSHEVHAFVSIRISYQPHNNVGDDTKTLSLGEPLVL